MTQFTTQNLIKDGEYLMYRRDVNPTQCNPNPYQFVARFKYGRGGMGSFKSFLIKFFTVEEYFAERAKNVAPLTIVEAKGYILPHIKRWAREGNKEAMEYIARRTGRCYNHTVIGRGGKLSYKE
jgi:hypothetical protein